MIFMCLIVLFIKRMTIVLKQYYVFEYIVFLFCFLIAKNNIILIDILKRYMT